MSVEDRCRFLANADANAARLTLLSTRLLDLARADLSVSSSPGKADLTQVLKRLCDANRSEEFAITTECAERMPPVAIPDASLDAVASALIENSRQVGASRIGGLRTAA